MLPLAPEGRPYVTLAAVVVAGSHALWGAAAWPGWILLAMALFIFRDFTRPITPKALAVVSPVDGVVTAISDDRNPFLDRKGRRVSLRQSLAGEFNVHSPIEGKVQRRWWPGKEGVDQKVPQDQFAVWIRSDEEDDLVFAVGLTGGLRYVRCGVQSGERMGQGRRCGFVGFGRPVDIYLPENSRVEVEVGQRVKAGSDIIGILIHKQNDRS